MVGPGRKKAFGQRFKVFLTVVFQLWPGIWGKVGKPFKGAYLFGRKLEFLSNFLNKVGVNLPSL